MAMPALPPSPPATSAPDASAGSALGESVVSIRGLHYWYGEGSSRTQALWDIDLEIGRGEIVILTGPSGSGKTTLLTLIGALRSVERGEVRVLGHDVVRLGPAARVALRREVGFIFQSHNLFSSLTAFENVRMATALKPGPVAEMNRRSEAILTRLGMRERFDHLPAELSGGQDQRVAIARALVNEPALVLAAGELRREVVEPLPHAQPGQDRLGPAVHLGDRPRLQRRGHAHVLDRRQRAEQVVELEDEADVPAQRHVPAPAQPGDVVAEHADLALLDAPQGADERQERRLARARRAG